MAREAWFTCPQCGFQMKAAANHNHHCRSCNHYPLLYGRVKAQPRITRQLPQVSGGLHPFACPHCHTVAYAPPGSQPTCPNCAKRIERQLSGSLPSLSGPLPPSPPSGTLFNAQTQPGTFPQVPQYVPSSFGKVMGTTWQRFTALSWKVQLGIIAGLLLLCVCVGVGAASQGGTTGSGTPPGSGASANTGGNGPHPQATQTPTATQIAAGTPTATLTPLPTATATPSPTPSPSPPPTPRPPTPTPKPSCKYPAVNGNPYCFTFTNTGKRIPSPPDDFCLYFDCITTFWSGSGYVVQCADGQYSLSGGKNGVCSGHGGYKRTLYQP